MTRLLPLWQKVPGFKKCRKPTPIINPLFHFSAGNGLAPDIHINGSVFNCTSCVYNYLKETDKQEEVNSAVVSGYFYDEETIQVFKLDFKTGQTFVLA